MAKPMEFLSENLINTTTMIKVDSATGLTQYMFDRNRNIGYSTVGYTSNTASVISVEFATPTVVSHVLFQGTNLNAVSVFYDSATANSLYSMTGNSASGIYIEFASTTVSSIQVQLNAADGERNIDELIICERVLAFERNPSYDNYTPTIFRKQVEHEMPDGGRVLFNIRDKFRGRLSWKFVTTTFHDALQGVFESAQPLYFIPFATTTGWDAKGYEVVWTGGFDFKHSTNDKVQGFSGSIDIKETPSG
jgi:hypothetical protein